MRIDNVVVMVLFSAVAACASPEFSEAHRAAVVDSVTTFAAEYVEAVNSSDMSDLIQYYDNDAEFHWVEDGRIEYDSFEAVREALAGLASSNATVELEILESKVIALAPGVAWVTSSYHQTFTFGPESSFEISGVMTFVLRHRADGWKFSMGHASETREREDEYQN